MKVESLVVTRFLVFCMRRAGMLMASWKQLAEQEMSVSSRNAYPYTFSAHFKDAPQPAEAQVSVDLGTEPRNLRVSVEVDSEELAGRIGAVLRTFSPESDPESWTDREWEEKFGVFERSLSRAGASWKGLQSGSIPLGNSLVTLLQREFEQCEDPVFREVILSALRRKGVARGLRLEVGRWLVGEFERERNEENRWKIGEVLTFYAAGELAPDLRRLLAERRFGDGRQMLCEALALTGAAQAAEALADVLDDETVAGHAIAALGRLRARAQAHKIRPFLHHRIGWWRREAAKTLKKMGAALEQGPAPHRVPDRTFPPPGLEEWSTTLDLDQLEPALGALSRQVESGFSSAEVAEVMVASGDMEPRQRRTFCFSVGFEGRTCDLWIQLFMEDQESSELFIGAPARLLSHIEFAVAAQLE